MLSSRKSATAVALQFHLAVGAGADTDGRRHVIAGPRWNSARGGRTQRKIIVRWPAQCPPTRSACDQSIGPDGRPCAAKAVADTAESTATSRHTNAIRIRSGLPKEQPRKYNKNERRNRQKEKVHPLNQPFFSDQPCRIEELTRMKRRTRFDWPEPACSRRMIGSASDPR